MAKYLIEKAIMFKNTKQMAEFLSNWQHFFSGLAGKLE